MQGVEGCAEPLRERLRPDAVEYPSKLLVRVAGEHFPTLEAVLLAESLEPLDFVNPCHRRHSS